MLFLVGSAGCGFSKSLEQLIFFRALSGLGAGGLMLFTNLVTHDTVPANIRHRYQSYNGMVSSVSDVYISRDIVAERGHIIAWYGIWITCGRLYY